MNPLRYCLSCWIPASKEKTEDAVAEDVNEEEENSDRSSLSSSSRAAPPPPPPPPPPSHVIASANAPPSVDAASPPAPGAESLANEAEAMENYIALDKCFSGARSTKVQTMPRLVQRDFHLLDLVPPSPCSLRENLGSLSGMPEVYAPMSPHKIPSRTPARGSLGGAGAHAADGSSKTQQVTPQSHRKELFTFEMKIPENQTSSSQSLKADLQNGRTVYNAPADHGHRMCGRAEFQNRIPCTSTSSDASSSMEVRACHKPSETLHSLHGSSSADHATDQPHYCNICVNPVDGVGGSQGLRIDDAAEFSESDAKWRPSSSKSQSCSWQTEGALKILHMSPQAPAAQKNKLKLQKYVNTRSGADFDLGDVSGFETFPSVKGCPEESAVGSCEGYYNILPTNSHSSRAEHASPPPPPLPPPCHGHPGCMKKQLKPKLNPKDRHRSDSVILPVRKKSTTNEDSSSSNDEAEEFCGRSSRANSNTSLNNNKFINSFPFNGFASKPPAPLPGPPQSIEYLQLDLDQPIIGSRGSPNAVHHHLFNSAPIDYIKIDPFRTKALSEAKKQLDSNRQNGKIPH